MSIQEKAESLVNEFGQHGIELDVEDTKARLQRLVDDFKVTEDDAYRSFRNNTARNHSVKLGSGKKETKDVSVECLEEDIPKGDWVNVEAKVERAYTSDSQSVKQSGIIAYGKNRARFVIYSNGTDGLEVEEGKSYKFLNVPVGVYKGQAQIGINKNSNLEEIEAVPVEDPTIEMTGAFIMNNTASGLVKRCPECNNSLNNKNECREHGKVENPVYTVRLIGDLDNGVSRRRINIGDELTTTLTGIDAEQGKEIAQEHLSMEEVANRMQEVVEGHYIQVTATPLGDTTLVKEAKLVA